MRAVLAIAAKDLRILSRDRLAVFWVLGFPVLFSLLFGAVFNTGADRDRAPVSVVLVAPDAPSPAADSFARALAREPSLRVATASAAEAERRVRAGSDVGWVRLAPTFPVPAPDGAAVQFYADPARTADGVRAHALVSAVLARALRTPSVALVPAFSGDSAGRLGSAVPASVLWALMACAATFAIAMVTERTSGALFRLRVAPVSAASVLGGKALACLSACAVSSSVVLVVSGLVFSVRVERPHLAAAVIAAAALCFSGMAVLLSTTGRTEQAVTGSGWGTMMVLAMTGGAMVPLSVMPAWARRAADFSPVQWGIAALEGAAFRGVDPSEIALRCALLAGLGLVCFVAGAARLARHEG